MKKNNGGIFSGIVGGFVLLIAGTILLWWNEGNVVKNNKAVKQLIEQVVDVSSEKVDSEYEGKVIATNGKLVTEDNEVTDTTFNVSIKTPVLRRVVEVYQWKEEETTDSNDNTTYTYEKVWSEYLIDSSNFRNSGYNNPTTMLYDGKAFIANSVKVGAFSLSADQLNSLEANSILSINAETVKKDTLNISGNYLTTAGDINNPTIGDVRISWVYNDWTEASVLAVQSGNSFKDFVSSEDVKINRVEKGLLNSNEIIQIIKKENNFLKWMLRLAGLLVLLIAYLSIISPITKLTSYVPILGNVVGGAFKLIAFLVALIHAIVVIAIAWLRFRPVLGISLLAVAAALVVYLIIRKKNKEVPANISENQ